MRFTSACWAAGRARLIACGCLCALATASGCARPRLGIPTGTGTPSATAATAYETAVQQCRNARTIRATLALSGRAGSTSLRGKVDAGFAAPDNVRLEGRHPLGRPVFILAATGSKAILYLPRDNRVLRDVAPAEIVEALVGLPLGPSELRTLVSGCGFALSEPSEGRAFAGGWMAVNTGDATTYLRQQSDAWHIVAARRPPLVVQYSSFTGGRASKLHLVATDGPGADLSVQVSDININIPLAAAVFTVDVPAGAEPLTLDELRRAGPLGGP